MLEIILLVLILGQVIMIPRVILASKISQVAGWHSLDVVHR